MSPQHIQSWVMKVQDLRVQFLGKTTGFLFSIHTVGMHRVMLMQGGLSVLLKYATLEDVVENLEVLARQLFPGKCAF